MLERHVKTFIAVEVDQENNADLWWSECRKKFPRFAQALADHDHAVIEDSLWHALADLPGFADGPDYARTALIDCGSVGDRWANVVGSTHRVFETLADM